MTSTFFIDQNMTGDQYFETTHPVEAKVDQIEVSQRPGPYHTWDGTAWQAPSSAEENTFLAASRDTLSLSKTDFASMARDLGWIDNAEFSAWRVSNTLPVWVDTAIDVYAANEALTSGGVADDIATDIKVHVATADVIHRNSSFLTLVKDAWNAQGGTVTDVQLDREFAFRMGIIASAEEG